MGRATCQILARNGAKVVVADINLAGAEETLNSLSGKLNNKPHSGNETRISGQKCRIFSLKLTYDKKV